jgi:hypothetical protein
VLSKARQATEPTDLVDSILRIVMHLPPSLVASARRKARRRRRRRGGGGSHRGTLPVTQLVQLDV